MKRRCPLFVILIALFGLTASAAWAGNAKVQVCHIPPGNPANFHTITISENALQAHLGHGDLAGACFAHCDTLCSDGNACTIDACDASERCITNHPPVNCDDGSLCTVDSCNPANGCSSVPKTCTDSDNCTVNSCDPLTGACVAPPVACPAGQTCNPTNGTCGSSVVCPCLNVPSTLFTQILAGEIPINACSLGALFGPGDGVLVYSPEYPSWLGYSVFDSGRWICGGPSGSGEEISPEEGQYCAQLLEQEAHRQGVTCVPRV